MYLWRRPSGWVFQIRIPSSLVSRFGGTPLRVRLGAINASDARHRARILAGHATALMMTMTDRKTVSNSLAALAEEMTQLRRDEFRAGVKILAAQSVWHSAEDEGVPLDPADLAEAKRREAEHRNFRDSIRSLRNRLAVLGAAIEKDGAEWEGERTAYAKALTIIGTIEKTVAPKAPEIAEEVDSGEPGTTRDTLLSVAVAPILQGRRDALEADGAKNRYADRLDNTAAAFIDVIGDKPLKSYLPVDLQTYANILGRIPKNRAKHKRFDGLSLREMADVNDGLAKPFPRLSKTSVQGYLSDFSTVWQAATAAVRDIRDITAARITMPRSAEPAIQREGLRPEKLNPWLADAVNYPKSEPHFYWLPALAFLTGLRLGEIVFLKPTDFVMVSDNQVIDLRRYVDIKPRRPLKNPNAERLVALHPILRDIGFLDWVESQRSSDWLFPELHSASDPADALQKRMGYWIRKLGIHKEQREVFHSLRHSAKAWMRLHVEDRVADFQCGHAPSGVGAKYGFRVLEPEEIEKIMECPPPRNVDFTPYLSRVTS
jgi:integrase